MIVSRIRLTMAAAAALLVMAPVAHAAGPTPAFALGPDGTPVSPGGGHNGIVLGEECPGDFNGDGNVDAAFPFVGTGSATVANGIVVMPGDGTGHLGTPATPVTTTASHLPHCASGDFNGDGRDDIAMVEESVVGIKIALGQANGSFAVTTIDTTTAAPGTLTSIATGDIDQDGKLDLAVTTKSPPANAVVPFKGDGTGGFAVAGLAVALTDIPVSVLLADVNNDTHPDAIVGLTGSSHIETAAGMQDGALAAAASQPFAGRSIGVADFDGNGAVDLANDIGSFVAIGRGNNSGNFVADGGNYPNPANANFFALSVAVGDLNNDGLPDVAAGARLLSGVPANVWTFAGTGNTAPGALLDTNAEGPYELKATNADARVALADFNNDGRVDILAGLSSGGEIGVLLNTTAVPGAVTGPAATVGDNNATVGGTIFPSGLTTQYGVDLISATGTVDRKAAVGSVSGAGSAPVSIPITGLTPDTTYRYRVYGISSNGTTVGKVRTLHTNTARPANQSPPTLDGTTTLTCGDGTWTGNPTFTIAWLRGGNVIAGESAHTYTVQPSDGGSAVGCRVTATNAGGSVSADSPTFVIGAGAFPTNVTKPSISKVGSTLACNAGAWSAGGAFTYSWLRDGNPIAGATGPGYTVTKTDAGHSLRCRVTLTNNAGSATADSDAVAIPALKCIVPKLRGATVASAKKKLKAANCLAGKVTRVRGRGVKIGRVLRTSPKAGASKKAGTRVKLFVRRV